MTKLLSGGSDGKIIIWNNKLDPLLSIVINQENFKSLNPKVRALSIEEETNKILVGTWGGELIDISVDSGTKWFILKSHYSKELWGLSTNC